jgi:riboflavin biosynthesis pyrimidine reductase
MMLSDVILASGRYVRDKAVGGSAQSIVPEADDPSVADLIEFRREAGLPLRPALAIVTSKASFDPVVAASLADDVIAVLGEEPDAETRATLEDLGLSVVAAGRNGRVTGELLVEALGELGHHVVFSAAGPQVFHTLIPVLDALYLTLAGRLLGGRAYSTLLEGDELEVPPSFDLASAYLDPEGPGGSVQLFLEFTRNRE